jgi:hypothetical protein
MKCVRCKEEKPASDFSPSAAWSTALHRWCKDCNRNRAQLRKHGLTHEQKLEIIAARGGCAICGHPDPSVKGWSVDHDHQCCGSDRSCPKCRRGVICQWCNTMLGNAFDRVQTLKAAIAYLEAPRTCDWHMPIACAPGLCTYVEDALTHVEGGY